jgi:hypothetical protein
MADVVAAMVRTSDAGRAGETWGAILAGAHHLTSTERLSRETATAWLDSVGWDYSHTQTDDVNHCAGFEGRQCLDHLLAHGVRWHDPDSEDPTTGSKTVRELVAMIRADLGGLDSAAKIAVGELGKLGIKATDDGLAVAGDAPGLTQIFGATRWAKNAHRSRLLEIEGAKKTNDAIHFPSDRTRRAVVVPWSAVDGDDTPEPAPQAPAAPPAAVDPAPAPITQPAATVAPPAPVKVAPPWRDKAMELHAAGKAFNTIALLLQADHGEVKGARVKAEIEAT